MAKRDGKHIDNEDQVRGFEAAFARICEVAGCRTQVELAEFLDIRQSSISDAKRRCSIPADWLIKIWRMTHVSPDWIMQGDVCGHKLAVPSNADESPVAVDTARLRVEITAELTNRIMDALGVADAKLETFTCTACGELYAGVPCTKHGDCTACAGFDHVAGQ